MVRGKLIVFEGLDRVGKSTQIQRVRAKLEERGHVVTVFSFPNMGVTTGPLLRKHLRGDITLVPEAAHHMFALNRKQTQPHIEEHLSRGHVVLCDRYMYSGIAYSQAQPEFTKSLEWCLRLERNLPEPNAVVYLCRNTDAIGCCKEPESPDEKLLKGNGADDSSSTFMKWEKRERYESEDLQKEVEKQLDSFARALSWKRVVARQPMEDVTYHILHAIDPVIQDKES